MLFWEDGLHLAGVVCLGAYLLDWMDEWMGWDGPGVGVKSIMVSTVLLYSGGLYRYMCSLGVVLSEIVIVPLFSKTCSPHDLSLRWSCGALLES